MKTRIYTNIDARRNTKETISAWKSVENVYIEVVKNNEFGLKEINIRLTKDEFQALIDELQKVA